MFNEIIIENLLLRTLITFSKGELQNELIPSIVRHLTSKIVPVHSIKILYKRKVEQMILY